LKKKVRILTTKVRILILIFIRTKANALGHKGTRAKATNKNAQPREHIGSSAKAYGCASEYSYWS
jgi:hypothetical protein